jgi:spectinomycin phosphotransferase
VFTEPSEVDRDALAAVLRRHWSIDVGSMDYLPLGFGSHHWIVTDTTSRRWFVTVDDLSQARWAGSAFDTLRRAFETALTLRRDVGLDFVVAPTPDEAGTVVQPVGPHHAASVFPFLDAGAGDFGEYSSDEDRRGVLGLVGRLHAATPRVRPDLPRRERFDLPGRDALTLALAQTDVPWQGGPYSEPARELLRSSAAEVQDLLRRYDAMAAEVATTGAIWVITHGEPHAGNILTDRRGAQLLIDWDTAAVGPRERDLWMLTDDAAPDWDTRDRDAYTATAGDVPLSRTALSLYRARWALQEICEYIAWFRRDHLRSEDTETAWSGLSAELPVRDVLRAQ